MWPMAMKTPSTTSSLTASVSRLRTTARVTTPLSTSPTSTSSVFHSKVILGLANALSCMIFDARSRSRRWRTVTCEANFVRKMASSMAESPPPTTAIGFSRKK